MTASSLGYTPGSGASVATDLDGGLHHQKTVVETLDVNGTPVPVSPTAPLPVSDVAAEDTRQSMVTLLVRMLNYLNAPMGYDKSLQRQRGTVVLESGTVTTVSTVTTVTTVTTVSSVTNIAAVGGYNAQMQILDTNRIAWAQCVRARIT